VFFLLGALVTITKKGRQFVRWAWAKTARSKSEPEPEPEPELQKLTLHHLFRDDFSIGSYKMLQGFSSDFHKGDVRLGTHNFEIGMYGDFAAKSLFMSLYVPADKHAYDIIAWFADGYNVYLEDARKNIHIFGHRMETTRSL
jgi:hypothetical protein